MTRPRAEMEWGVDLFGWIMCLQKPLYDFLGDVLSNRLFLAVLMEQN